jgi:hypothetical protein
MPFDWSYELGALAQVVLIDVALAGDNAVVVGLAASRGGGVGDVVSRISSAF